MTVNRPATTNSSRSPRCPTSRNNGCRINRPATTSPTTAATVYSASVEPVGVPSSTGARDMEAMMVIIGTSARSWNSRIEKARSPCFSCISPDERSIGSTCAVDDSASGRPMARLAGMLTASAK